MQVKSVNVWLYFFLMTRLPLYSQVAASHQICIKIVRPNIMAITNIPSMTTARPQSVFLLKWQTDSHPKKITLSIKENPSSQPLQIETDLHATESLTLSRQDQDLLEVRSEGKGQRHLKIIQSMNDNTNGPVEVFFTLVEN